MSIEISKEVFSLYQVAKELGVARHRIVYAVATDKVKMPLKISGRYMYTRANIEELKNYFADGNDLNKLEER